MANVALGSSLTACVAFAGLIEPVFAGGMSGVPAPIIGVGLPGLALAAGVYWVVKVIRNRRNG